MKYDSTKLAFVHHMDTTCINCFVVCCYEYPNKSQKIDLRNPKKMSEEFYLT